MVINILQGRKGSYWSAVDRLAEQTSLPQISASAYCQARQKVPHELLSSLSQHTLDFIDSENLRQKWKGHRVLAVDGSGAQLPLHPTTQARFALKDGKPEARISMMYDVLNHLVEDITMDSIRVSEHELFQQHLGKVQENDIVIFDGGYASKINMASIISKNAFFIMRLTTQWTCVKELLESNENEWYVDFEILRKHPNLKDSMPKKFSVRLIKVTRRDGSQVVFATNLMNRKEYNINKIIELYKERWQIEEGYKRMKSRLLLTNWSGKRIECIFQDLHAVALVCNLGGLLCLCTERPKHPRKKKGKTRQVAKFNRSLALTKAKDIVWRMLTLTIDNEYINEVLIKLHKRYERSRIGEHKPRKDNKRRQYSTNYVMA